MESIVVAYDRNRGIGLGNRLLWSINSMSEDMKRFRNITIGNTVVWGLNTLESIGKALPRRRNLVLTHRLDYKMPGVEVYHSWEELACAIVPDEHTIYAGGASMYCHALNRVDFIYATEVDASLKADTFFPEIDNRLWHEIEREHHPVSTENVYPMDFVTYVRKNT